MSQSQSLGILSLLWGGTKINVDPKSSSFSPGGYLNTPVVAGATITIAQSFSPSMVKASFPLTKGMSLNALNALNGSELQVICDSGQTYVIDSASFTKDRTVKGGAGNNVSAEWSGPPASEVIK